MAEKDIGTPLFKEASSDDGNDPLQMYPTAGAGAIRRPASRRQMRRRLSLSSVRPVRSNPSTNH
jgi:hypothetical protein